MSIPLLFFVFFHASTATKDFIGHRIPIKSNIKIVGRRTLVRVSVSGVQGLMVSMVSWNCPCRTYLSKHVYFPQLGPIDNTGCTFRLGSLPDARKSSTSETCGSFLGWVLDTGRWALHHAVRGQLRDSLPSCHERHRHRPWLQH